MEVYLIFHLLLLFNIFDIYRFDLVDPLSRHNLGTPNENNKNKSNSETISACNVCRLSTKSFNTVSSLDSERIRNFIAKKKKKKFESINLILRNFQVYKYIGKQKVKEDLAIWEGNNLVLKDPSTDLLSEIKQHLCTDLKVGKAEVNLSKFFSIHS